MKLRNLLLLLAVQAAISCTTTPEVPKEEGEGATDGCHTPLGFIPEGTSATGYLHPIEHGTPCQQGQLTCADGVWAGAYIYPSCIPQ